MLHHFHKDKNNICIVQYLYCLFRNEKTHTAGKTPQLFQKNAEFFLLDEEMAARLVSISYCTGVCPRVLFQGEGNCCYTIDRNIFNLDALCAACPGTFIPVTLIEIFSISTFCGNHNTRKFLASWGVKGDTTALW